MSAALLDLAQFDGHTPGPGRVRELSRDSRGMGWIVGPDGIDVSCFGATERTDEENRANGLLYAAAPSLLAECKQRRADREEDCALIDAQRKQITELAAALRITVDELSGCGSGAYCQSEADPSVLAQARAALFKVKS